MDQPSLSTGDRVGVTDGAFSGMEGTVLGVDEETVQVEVIVFGRAVTLELEWDQLSREGQPLRPPGPPPAPPPPDTPETAAFHNAMRDDPSNDLVRLVYADWLEERSDPHHEYLRTQVAHADALRRGQPFDQPVCREQELRRLLDPDWVGRVRRLTTEPPTRDVGALVPALAEHARVAVRLHPRQGHVPELNASKLGGLFLWPDDEPWPVIRDFRYSEWYREHLSNVPHDRENAPPEGADVPLAPVLQLRARDFPNVEFPPGMDLLQLFWSPIWSEENGPVPFLFWRNSGEVTRPRLSVPELTYAEQGLGPVPCRLHPERVVEYPLRCNYPADDAVPDHRAWMEQLARALGMTVEEVEADYINLWSVVRGCKVGGYPRGNQWGVPLQLEGGREADYLLSLSLWEINPNHARWCPLEDRDLLNPTRARRFKDELTGGFGHFGRGDYFVLVDRTTEPWAVRSYYDYT
jgi:uncharacterized protein (TIGR02996 family)